MSFPHEESFTKTCRRRVNMTHCATTGSLQTWNEGLFSSSPLKQYESKGTILAVLKKQKTDYKSTINPRACTHHRRLLRKDVPENIRELRESQRTDITTSSSWITFLISSRCPSSFTTISTLSSSVNSNTPGIPMVGLASGAGLNCPVKLINIYTWCA